MGHHLIIIFSCFLCVWLLLPFTLLHNSCFTHTLLSLSLPLFYLLLLNFSLLILSHLLFHPSHPCSLLYLSLYLSMAVQAQYPSNVLLLNRFVSLLYPSLSLSLLSIFRLCSSLCFAFLFAETSKRVMIIHCNRNQDDFLINPICYSPMEVSPTLQFFLLLLVVNVEIVKKM